MKALILPLAISASLIPMAATAQTPRGVLFTGGSVGESASFYAGGVSSLPGASLGHGAAVRLGVNGGRYKYDAGATRITAKYAGADAALVYQFSGRWGWANVSAGPRFTHTSLSPPDPGNERRGSRWDLGLQSDGAFDGSAWRLGWYGSLGVVDEAYQARLHLSRKLGAKGFRLGIEGGIQGDPSYTKGMFGGFISKPIGGGFELQAGSGITKQRDRQPRLYGSLSLSKLF